MHIFNISVSYQVHRKLYEKIFHKICTINHYLPGAAVEKKAKLKTL